MKIYSINCDCLKIKKQIDGKVSIISKCLISSFIKYSTISEYELNDLLIKL